MMIEEKLKDGVLNPPAPESKLSELALSLGYSLPADYVRFLQRHDGAEGFIGENYLILWKAEELIRFNREYEVEQYAPGIFLFGSNGGGEGYGFDIQDPATPVVRVPFIGMDRRHAKRVASDFTDLFSRLE